MAKKKAAPAKQKAPGDPKVSPEEAQQFQRRGQPTMDLSEYTGFLDQLGPGEWRRVHLVEEEKQRTIKRRLTRRNPSSNSEATS